MSAQRPIAQLRTNLHRVTRLGLPLEKLEQCDGCHRLFSLQQVELLGPQILCTDCAPAEFTIAPPVNLPRLPHPLGL